MKDLSFVLTPLDQYGTEEECKNRQKYIKLKKKYNLINDQLRKEIVNKLEQEKKSLKEVSNFFSIKLSTCKAIYQIYQKEGRIEKKKKRIRKTRTQINKFNSQNKITAPWLLFPDKETFLSKFPDFKQLFSSFDTDKKQKTLQNQGFKINLNYVKNSSTHNDQDSETEILTNCSTNFVSFGKLSPNIGKKILNLTDNLYYEPSCGISTRESIDDMANLIVEEENFNHLKVLEEMWKEIFSFFGEK